MFASSLFSLPSVRKLGSLKRLTLGAPREKLFSLVDMGALSLKYRLLAAIPAVFLATLFFLDQNITVRTVNSPQNKLKKGAAYHLDLFALASITLASSLLGLPWMCSATVQSLNHVRALSTYADQETQTVEKVDTPPNKPSKPAPLAAPAAQKRPLPSPDEIIRAAKTEPPAKSPSRRPATSSSRGLSCRSRNGPPRNLRKGLVLAATRTTTWRSSIKHCQVNRTQEDRAEAVAAASRATAGGGAARVAQAKELASKPVNVVTKPTVSGDVKDVVETRLTGFTVHALVLASLGFAPVLSRSTFSRRLGRVPLPRLQGHGGQPVSREGRLFVY